MRSSAATINSRMRVAGAVGGVGRKMELPVVVTLTVKVVGTPLVTITLEGAWHVAAVGAPVQLSEIVPE